MFKSASLLKALLQLQKPDASQAYSHDDVCPENAHAPAGEAAVLNDLYLCEITSAEDPLRWTPIAASNPPPPRSSHAALAVSDNEASLPFVEEGE